MAYRSTGAGTYHAKPAASPCNTTAPNSTITARTASTLCAFGAALQQDARIRARINEWLRAVVADTIVDRRDVIASVVWRVIRKWDAETVSRKFELQVGKDLQYIRLNGTLVGGVVGVVLHGLAAGFAW